MEISQRHWARFKFPCWNQLANEPVVVILGFPLTNWASNQASNRIARVFQEESQCLLSSYNAT